MNSNLEQQQFDGSEVQLMINSHAWKLVWSKMLDELDQLDVQTEDSYDPNVHLACNKEKRGIMKVKECADEIIQYGIEAHKELLA